MTTLSALTPDAWTVVAIRCPGEPFDWWDWRLSDHEQDRLAEMRLAGHLLTAQQRDPDTGQSRLLARMASRGRKVVVASGATMGLGAARKPVEADVGRFRSHVAGEDLSGVLGPVLGLGLFEV